MTNTDCAPTCVSAIPALKRSRIIGPRCRHGPVQYWNHITEQTTERSKHRAIKRRVNAKQGFRAFGAARRTVDGYEAVHMLRKEQVRRLPGQDLKGQLRFVDQLFGLSK